MPLAGSSESTGNTSKLPDHERPHRCLALAGVDAHGAPLGTDEIRLTKEKMNWPHEPTFFIPAEVPAFFKQAADRVKAASGSSKSGSSGGLSFDEMVDRGYVVIGTPTSVAEQLTEVATSLNVGNLMLLCQFGNMDRDLTRFNTELMAREVLPEIRDLFADEWEHRWWIRPMEADESGSPTPSGMAW